MQILSIIGTRPQYIKVKPFYDFCISRGIDHQILDTLQHYSDGVSKDLIKDLDLSINFNLDIKNKDEINFISQCIKKISEILEKRKPGFVLVYGDTNSTFCAALACYKAKIPFGHVEAGLRCGDIKVPEEVNRIFSDLTADIHFCPTRIPEESSLSNPVIVGDLEYELLNTFNPEISFGDYGVMTLHRQDNCNPKRLQEILDFCGRLQGNIIYPVHHRMNRYLQNASIPSNIETVDPLSYTKMIEKLSGCGFILTDSGGIQKISPFFGKPALIFRSKTEWQETETRGYCQKFDSIKGAEEFLGRKLTPDKRFYLIGDHSPSEKIYEKIKTYI
jgi:UDP-N-acetylglucosamine 2-epimerase